MNVPLQRRGPVLVAALLLILTLAIALAAAPFGAAQAADAPAAPAPAAPAAPDAACSGGPTIDGVTLDECVVNNFTVGGDSRSITVWYTENVSTATRDLDDGSTINLTHYVNSDAEAQQVADWAQEAWEIFYDIFSHHPYTTGCSNNLNIQLEDLASGAGVAYWASSGNCTIGINSPTVRAGNAQRTTYHEVQHYLQYSYDDGCYADLQSNYDDNAEFVEGYADLSEDSVNAAVDAVAHGGSVSGYDPTNSLYDEGYMNVWTKYFVEHAGSRGTSADPDHGWDAVRKHYEVCDDQDTLYVLPSVIPALTGMSEEEFFLDFFAANWAKEWADDATQPELVYFDDDGNPYGTVNVQQDFNLSTSQSFPGESTPETWAGQYYQATPQSGCDYVTVEVDGEAGAVLGINLMAADTSGATSVSRSAWIGEDFTRTFAGWGVHHRIVAAVNAFGNPYDYDVSFSCVSPSVELLDPRPRPNSTLVGQPDSPTAFLGRFRVTDGGSPVRGLVADSFSANAEGSAITIQTGSFQEIGEEYWAVMVPPTQPAGTTYVDMELCLDNALCDTNSDALLYVPPGNSDLALLFDGSGSMDFEDVPGQGTRLVNAKKAGAVMADLLVDGDRVLVMDFSAHSCSGDDCTFDINTYLTRSEIPTGATIGDVHDAIDMVSARDRTPIGEALVRAKDALLASPAGENPKSIVLLSDGEQNVNPKYADVRTEIVDSGVIVNTVGLSSEADEGLMAQIAGDTGGTYRFVPTTPGTLGPAQAAPEAVAAELEALGVAPEMAESIAATTAYLPGPLRIDEVYDQFETEAQDASRIMQTNDANLALNTWRESFANVDESATMLRLVVGAQHPDMGSGCQQLDRRTEVLPPGADPEEGWIPVNPPRNVPAGWDVRHSTFDDVVIIPAPEAGEWGLRTLYRYGLCAATAGEIPEAIAQSSYPVMLNASIQTPYKLEGYFPQGAIQKAGNKVHVVGALMDANGTIPGAAFGSCPGLIGVVERPGGAVQFFCLPDDGGNLDGGPDDGLYGGSYAITDIGGSYTLSLFAIFEDPAQPGQQLVRQWKSTFWIDGPEEQDPDRGDADGDGMPDVWEIRCGLDPKVNDAQGDLDEDWLSNAEELRRGTLPCDPDTDDGGETDGSEVEFGRNPLWPDDDDVPKLGYVSVQPRPGQIRVYWANPPGITSVNITLVNGQTQTFLAKPTGEYFIPNVQNGTGYTVTLSLENNGAVGPPSPPQSVVPREDYVRPQGSVLINQDARATHSRHVTLNIDALDSFEQGPYALLAPEARAALLGPRHGEEGAATGVAEMRIAEDPAAFHDEEAGWREFQRDVRWELRRCSVGETCAVYVQFRDEAGNLSIIVSDEILLERLRLLLPVIQR